MDLHWHSIDSYFTFSFIYYTQFFYSWFFIHSIYFTTTVNKVSICHVKSALSYLYILTIFISRTFIVCFIFLFYFIIIFMFTLLLCEREKILCAKLRNENSIRQIVNSCKFKIYCTRCQLTNWRREIIREYVVAVKMLALLMHSHIFLLLPLTHFSSCLNYIYRLQKLSSKLRYARYLTWFVNVHSRESTFSSKKS